MKPNILATSSAAELMRSYVSPIVHNLSIFASLGCLVFLIIGGFYYMSSSGRPEKLESAKRTIRNALVGLVIVLAASALTSFLAQSYNQAPSHVSSSLPSLTTIQPDSSSGGLADILIKAVTGLLNNVVQSAASPFLKALSYFTSSTPLMAANPSVFNLWLVIVGMSDAIFVLVIALVGFHVMSASTFGLDELELKHLFPQIALIFCLINSSLFVIDTIIGFSNAMIHALQASTSSISVWPVLTTIVKQAGAYGLAALLIMVVFLIFAAILLVYYVGRIVALYIGAVLAPLILLTWLIPGFRDFAHNAAKTYIAIIFVLFVHVVILELAASLFSGMIAASPNHTADPLMAMIVGLATLVALLKTQGVMQQMSYASIGPRTARQLGGKFMNGVGYVTMFGSNSVANYRRLESESFSRNLVKMRADPPAVIPYSKKLKGLPKTSPSFSPTSKPQLPNTATSKPKTIKDKNS